MLLLVALGWLAVATAAALVVGRTVRLRTPGRQPMTTTCSGGSTRSSRDSRTTSGPPPVRRPSDEHELSCRPARDGEGPSLVGIRPLPEPGRVGPGPA